MSSLGERTHLPAALVTGACGVMGIAISRRLAERHLVYLADIDADALQAAATTLRREAASVYPLVCDVTSPASVDAAFATIRKESDGLAALVHVVAVSPSMADWDRIVSLNLGGAALVADRAGLVIRQGGAAVLISSVGGHMIVPNDAERAVIDAPLLPDLSAKLLAAHGGSSDSTAAYMLSKYGLMRLSRRLAVDWGAQGKRIVTLSPGFIATAMGDLEFQHQPAKHAFLARMPIPRLGSVIEVADAVDFLISDRASYITGCDLLIDGGMSAIIP